MGSKSSGSSSTVTKPWDPQDPFLIQTFNEAQKLYEGYTPQWYQGTQVAPFTGWQQQAQQGLANYATGGAQQTANQAAQANAVGMSGSLLYPQSNPALQQTAYAATLPLYQQLNEQYLPAIRGGAVGAGQYGSSRQGIAEGLAADRTAQAAGAVTADIYNKGYETGLDAFIKSLALAPQTTQLGAMPSAYLEAAGAPQQDYQQALIDAAMAQWDWEQALPYQQLAEYQNLVSGSFGGSGTSSLSQPSTASRLVGGAMGALSGGLAGGAISGALTGAQAGAIVPGWGMAIGAGLGLLSAFM